MRAQLQHVRVPRATYRVQLHSEFRFTDATALVPYLAALGISDLYCSPYLRARPGSRHGYDIVDHTMLNPEIGSREDFEAMADALSAQGMSQMCDVVPNHMAVMGKDNAWWMDVLENGPASAYAAFFDIEWQPQDRDLAGKVLVPVLGDPYGAVLERGELVLHFEDEGGAFAIRYHEHRFPLDPRECAPIVELALAAVADRLASDTAMEVQRLVDRLRALPSRSETEPSRIDARRSGARACKESLARLAASHAILREAIDVVVRRFNGTPGVAASFEPLDALLETQAFRLAFWRVASDEINYRRFFDVNDLAALRMEDEQVFEATHGFLLGLAATGRIGALRIDHPDGLHDPAAYFARLQVRYRELAEASGGGESRPIYVAIEKIAAPHETLPADWQVHGDTGYRFANDIVSVLVDPTARRRVERAWRSFVGDATRDFEHAAYQGKLDVMRGPLAAGLNRLANAALRLARTDRRTRDFTFSTLRQALAETVAWFPVYRTYVSGRGVSPQDRRYVDWAVSRARRGNRFADAAIFDFLRSLLLAAPQGELPRSAHQRYLEFATQFQQYTAPVAAKGVEDTSFYTYAPLACLNDVGGDPGVFGMTRRAFHTATAKRARAWPHTMLATSTHDNKRSEDVRARIAVISELAAAWRLDVRRWTRMNRSRRKTLPEGIAPSPSDEYLLYQTLIGSFPASPEAGSLEDYRRRVRDYAIKAAREAKQRTSWLQVDVQYEEALVSFVDAILADGADNRFVEDLRAQVEVFAWFGFLNSLSMIVVKLGVPGVPDFYQGNELLDFSLVDPDNRRPVDYALRRTRLGDVQRIERDVAAAGDASPLRELFASPYEGRAKLWIAYRMLQFRKRNAQLFDAGGYSPITAKGRRARNVLAFARGTDAQRIVVVTGRLFASMDVGVGTLPLGSCWDDTRLDFEGPAAGTRVRNILTGETFVAGEEMLSMSTLFRVFPGAVLSW